MMERNFSEVILDIARVYGELSPENLYRDGEASPAEVARERARLTEKLEALFAERGSPLEENEAYEFAARIRKRPEWSAADRLSCERFEPGNPIARGKSHEMADVGPYEEPHCIFCGWQRDEDDYSLTGYRG